MRQTHNKRSQCALPLSTPTTSADRIAVGVVLRKMVVVAVVAMTLQVVEAVVELVV